MSDWIARLFGTNRPQKLSAIEQLASAQSRALVELCKQQQALISSQHASLDKIVTARYDRPFAAPVNPEPNATMPPGMLYDQDMSEQPMDVSAALAVESDAEFLKAVGANPNG